MCNDISNKTASKSERYKKYRDMLFDAGFSEAKLKEGHFFKQATENTAFVINLEDGDSAVSVLYGFTSTSYMKGDEETFVNYGSFNDECKVRNILYISDDIGEIKASESITEFYNRYKSYSKDEISVLKKEKQKEFLEYFKKALKPFEFKKRNTRWTKDLGDGTSLTLEAQKSAFSDQYYFNVIIHDTLDFYASKSYERVVMHKTNIYNWQLMTESQIDELINCTLINYILPKLKNKSI